jgi:hypothetical protein
MIFLTKKPETLFFWQLNSAENKRRVVCCFFSKKKRDEQQFIYTFKKLKKIKPSPCARAGLLIF